MKLLLNNDDRKLYSFRFRFIYRQLYNVYMDDRNFIRKHFRIEKIFDIDVDSYVYLGIVYRTELEAYYPRTLIGFSILSQYIKDSRMKKVDMSDVRE